MVRKVKFALVFAVTSIVGAGLHYALPQTDIVRIVATETKRMDDVDELGRKGNRDVYFIQAEYAKSGKPSVYRNEDNLIYLKKNSADVQAAAAKLSKGENVYVVVKHYGWRNSWFSWFPNVLSVKQVDPGYSAFPIGNIIILTFLGGIGFAIWRQFRKLKNRVASAVSGSGSSRRTVASVDLADDDMLDDFLNSNSNSGSGSGSTSSGSDFCGGDD
jgi:hypothetical protein